MNKRLNNFFKMLLCDFENLIEGTIHLIKVKEVGNVYWVKQCASGLFDDYYWFSGIRTKDDKKVQIEFIRTDISSIKIGVNSRKKTKFTILLLNGNQIEINMRGEKSVGKLLL